MTEPSSRSSELSRSPLQTAMRRVEDARRATYENRNRRDALLSALRNAATTIEQGRLPSVSEAITATPWPEAEQPDFDSRVGLCTSSLKRLALVDQLFGRSSDASAAVVRSHVLKLAESINANDPHAGNLCEQVLSESSPYSAVLALASKSGDLSDSAWDKAVATLREAFGDDVAIAAMRGRLFGAVASPVAVVSEPAVAPESKPAKSQLSAERNDVDADESRQRAALSESSAPEAGIGPADLSVASDAVNFEAVSEADLEDSTWLQSIKGQLAYDSGPTVQVDAWTFLARGENGLAYHLTGPNEHPGQDVVAVWALSRRLALPYGSLSVALERAIGKISIEDLNGEEVLLLRAALLRPALLAVETRASALLRNLPRSSAHSAFDNFSLRVASAGDRLGGLLAREFKSFSAVEVRAELDNWLEHVKSRISYRLDRPLYLRTHWSLRTPEHAGRVSEVERWRMQRPLEQLVSRVVRPLLAEGPGHWRRVRTEAERIDQLLEQGDVAEAERSLLAEGCALARHFGSSHTRSPGAGFVPAEVSELATELKSRRKAIRDELTVYSHKSGTDADKVVASLVDAALDDIEKLLDPDVPMMPHEPDLVHVLHGDLLKVPAVVTGPDWSPVGSRSEVSERLARYSLRAPISWEQAFLAHARVRSAESCDRILEAAEWVPSQRQRAMKRRDEVFASTESTLLDDLSDVQELVREAVRLHVIDEDAAHAIRRRLEHVKFDDVDADEISAFAKLAQDLRERLIVRRRSRAAAIEQRRRELNSSVSKASPVEQPAPPDPPPQLDATSVFDD